MGRFTHDIDSPPPPLAGLYFKLHGNHRPNTMKKAVIKRRKRISAAGTSGENVPGRGSDLAAVASEAMVAVGRLGGSRRIADLSPLQILVLCATEARPRPNSMKKAVI